MKLQISPYVDGYWGAEKELSVVPEPRFPFRNNPTPDVFSRHFVRSYLGRPRAFVSKLADRTTWENVVLRSEALSNASWTATAVSVTDNDATAPDGNDTMAKVLETAATSEHSLTQAVTLTAAAWEVSVFAKAGLTRTWLRLSFVDSAAATRFAYFNVASGYVGTKSSDVTSQIVNLGGGYFRCVLRLTPAAGAGTLKINLATADGTISYTGSTSAGAYLWGAQATLGTLTPYISTTSTSRTIIAPQRDPHDPFAYMIEEDDIRLQNSEAANFTRTFSRIPNQQIVPDSRFVTKPDLPGEFPQVSGNALIIQPDENVPRWLFYTNKVVTSDTGVPTGVVPTGGTWTVTIGASTTGALAYNITAAALKIALDALPTVSVRGSMTVSGSYTAGYVVAFGAFSAITANTAGLTTGASFTAFSLNNPVVEVRRLFFSLTCLGAGLGSSSIGTCNITGGTFTITIFGQTSTAIPYNGTISDVQTAIAGMTNLPAGTTVVYGGGAGFISPGILRQFGAFNADVIQFIIEVAVPTVTVTGTSLTPTGSAANITAGATFSYTIRLTGVNLGIRTLTSSGHGISAADSIVLTQGTNYRTLTPGSFSVTTDTIVLTAASGEAFSTATLITLVGSATGAEYTSGSKLTRIKRVTDYYLIGVSDGIATIDDIPLPTYQGDSASLLAAIFAGTTDINYEVGELAVYRNGPIVQRTRTTLDASQL